MSRVQMDDLKRLHDAAKGTGGITSRDGQKFVVAIFERWPEIYETAKYLTRCNNVFGTVLTNIQNMSADEAAQSAQGSARCALVDMRTKESKQSENA